MNKIQATWRGLSFTQRIYLLFLIFFILLVPVIVGLVNKPTYHRSQASEPVTPVTPPSIIPPTVIVATATPIIRPTNTPTPTIKPTSTPIPTPTPIITVVLNSHTGKTCNTICSTVVPGSVCKSTGTDLQGTNGLFYKYRVDTTLCNTFTSNCNQIMKNMTGTCPKNGNNRNNWTYCRCSK